MEYFGFPLNVFSENFVWNFTKISKPNSNYFKSPTQIIDTLHEDMHMFISLVSTIEKGCRDAGVS